ncbi:MAG: helix-turn-helix domain-containing protein [Nocardioides sp.]
MTAEDAFWTDLQDELASDPEAASQYLLEWVRITTVDRIVNRLDELREAQGWSKARLARAVHRDSAAIRRLLSDATGNPTVETLSSVAAATGYKLELVPMSEDEREALTAVARGGELVVT